jgi:hypothetical protein
MPPTADSDCRYSMVWLMWNGSRNVCGEEITAKS